MYAQAGLSLFPCRTYHIVGNLMHWLINLFIIPPPLHPPRGSGEDSKTTYIGNCYGMLLTILILVINYICFGKKMVVQVKVN